MPGDFETLIPRERLVSRCIYTYLFYELSRTLSRVLLQYRYTHGAHTCFLPCTAPIPYGMRSRRKCCIRGAVRVPERCRTPYPHVSSPEAVEAAHSAAPVPMTKPSCQWTACSVASAALLHRRLSHNRRGPERCCCAVVGLTGRAGRGRLSSLVPDEQLAPALHARQRAARAPIARRGELLLDLSARSAVPAAVERVSTSTAGVRCAPTVRAPSETAAVASIGAPPTAMQGDFFFLKR
jgi:hypothetical protein